jgi:hypothetical protein
VQVNIIDPMTIMLIFIAFFLLVLIVVVIVMLATRNKDHSKDRKEYNTLNSKTEKVDNMDLAMKDRSGRKDVDFGGSHSPGYNANYSSANYNNRQSANNNNGNFQGTVSIEQMGAPGFTGSETQMLDTPMSSSYKHERVIISYSVGNVLKMFEMTSDSIKIGRDSVCDICITSDIYLGREHCQLRWEGDILVLQNINAKNGTSINGMRIDNSARITAGCEIKLGSSLLSLQFGGK